MGVPFPHIHVWWNIDVYKGNIVLREEKRFAKQKKRLDIVIIVMKVYDIYTCPNGFDQDCSSGDF